LSLRKRCERQRCCQAGGAISSDRQPEPATRLTRLQGIRSARHQRYL